MHSLKNENPTFPSSKGSLKAWFLASRPKTWIASMAPVFTGTLMAEKISLFYFFSALLFSLLIQIGTNFANDYFDFVKGADTDKRVGPKRAVQQGWISKDAMKQGIKIVFSLALLISLPLMIKVGPISLIVVFFSILFGIWYTGGSKPLGYLGLGELLVFIFFGPVATIGSYLLQSGFIHEKALIASLPMGLFSCALLIANNLRDHETDSLANKKTLVVRFGTLFGSLEYAFCIAFSFSTPLLLVFFYQAPLNLLSCFFLFPIGLKLIQKTFFEKDLTPLLQGTTFLFSFYTLLFCLSYL